MQIFNFILIAATLIFASNCLFSHIKKLHVHVPVLSGKVEINFILMGLYYSPQLY